jgi:hypothetical protein
MNRIGEDKTINRLKEIAIEESNKAISAGAYPDGSDKIIAELFDVFGKFEDDPEQLIVELQLFNDKILADKMYNDSIIIAFTNLSLHSAIFWNNFEKDNSVGVKGKGRTVFIAASDVLSGVTAGWHRSKVGATVGAVFVNPLAGIIIGGIGGLVLGAIVGSGTAYYGSR